MSTNKERKINIIDLLFVIVLLGIILFAVVKFATPNSSKPKSATKISYALEVNNAFPEVMSYIREGDKVFDDESMKEIGVVCEISEKNATVLAENLDDGTLNNAEVEDRINLWIKVIADGEVSSGNASVNSVNLLIGKTMECIVGDAYIDAVIVNVEYEDSTQVKEALSE